MVTIDDTGRATLVIPPAVPIANRQAAPIVYDMTTVAYVVDPDFILTADNLFSGRVRAVVVPPERAIDIDTDLDFRIAELMLADRAAAAG
jgi:N-acylneuraminate cytidylyltransferase